MPFAGYKDFADCVSQNKDKKDPEGYCSVIMRQVEKAEWDTATINNLPDSAFAYIAPGGKKDSEGKTTPRSLRYLPHHNAAGDVDQAHLNNALARVNQADIPASAKSSAVSHLEEHKKEEKVSKGLTDKQITPHTKVDEEIVSLNPGEVSLTLRPAVRENVLMAKSEIMTEEQLKDLAKSLGVESPEKLTEEQIKKAEEEIEAQKHMPGDMGGGMGGGTPPGGGGTPNPFEKKPPQDPNPPAFLDKSVSQYVTMAAKMLAPVMPSLPMEVQKFFSGGAAGSATPGQEPVMKSEEQVELFKSVFPNVEAAIRQPLDTEIAELRKSVEALQTDAETRELIEVAKSVSAADPTETAKRLLAIRKSLSKEEYDAYIKEQQSLFGLVQKSPAFAQISKSNGSEATAEVQILAKATELISKSEDKDLAKAVETVMNTNPELASQYQSEMTRKAAMSGVEG